MKVLEKYKRERMRVTPQEAKKLAIQVQLGQMRQIADNYDREIFELNQSKNYPEAKKKYDEFQEEMIKDLEKLKQIKERDQVTEKGQVEKTGHITIL